VADATIGCCWFNKTTDKPHANKGGVRMAIITVSRQLGSFGDEIAQNVANHLNYEYVDKLKIGEAVALQGLPAAQMEKFDEKKPSFWDAFSDQRKKFSHTIRAVLYDFAGKNNTVILGRGGQVLLKNLPGTLHVRIIAPFETRMERIIEQEHYDSRNGDRILRRSDRESFGYIRSFFGADWDDKNLYDLIVNTKVISIDTGVKMIVDTISSEKYQGSFEQTVEKLSDLALLQKAETLLMEMSDVEDRVSVLKVEKGVVILTGLVHSAEIKEECENKISEIKGVIRIKNEILVGKPVERI